LFERVLVVFQLRLEEGVGEEIAPADDLDSEAFDLSIAAFFISPVG